MPDLKNPIKLDMPSTQSRHTRYNTKPERMGIHGLASYLKWKVGGAVRRPVSWTAGTAGERWAVDCACLLYKAEAAGLSPLTVVASLIVRIRRAGAEPVFFFDGRAPVAKAAVSEQRRAARTAARVRTAALEEELATITDMTEADRGDREVEIAALRAAAPTVRRSAIGEVKRFLYAAGVLGVTAAGEADDLIAWLFRRGDITAVVTTDYDMLARGVGRMLVPENADATVWSQIELAVVLTALRVEYPQFVRACVGMGCDYSPPGWNGCLPAVALQWARTGEEGGWASLVRGGAAAAAIDVAGLERAEAMLRGDGVTWESLLDERQQEKWAGGAPPREPEEMDRCFAEHRWPAEWRTFL